MNKKIVKLTENDLHRIIKESVKNALNEGYSQSNELQRIAYENQQIRPMIKELSNFAMTVAKIGKMRGQDNYYNFYKKLALDISEMNNLWNFLDNND